MDDGLVVLALFWLALLRRVLDGCVDNNEAKLLQVKVPSSFMFNPSPSRIEQIP